MSSCNFARQIGNYRLGSIQVRLVDSTRVRDETLPVENVITPPYPSKLVNKLLVSVLLVAQTGSVLRHGAARHRAPCVGLAGISRRQLFAHNVALLPTHNGYHASFTTVTFAQASQCRTRDARPDLFDAFHTIAEVPAGQPFDLDLNHRLVIRAIE